MVLSRSLTLNREPERRGTPSLCTRAALRGAQRPNYGRGRSGRYARRERRSSRATFVVVMQTADVWDCDDRATGWRLGSPMEGSILVQ